MDLTELQRQRTAIGIRHPWEITRARIVRYLVNKFSDSPASGIVEIGSGDAFLLRQLALSVPAEKFSALDTAYTPEIINELKKDPASQKIGYFSSSRDLEQANGPADLILLPDVLEHNEQDIALWSFACQNVISRPGATLLATVPAFQSLFSNHDELLNHYRRYNRRQLEELCKRENIVIIRSGYFFFSLFILRYCQKMLEKSGIKRKTKTLESWRRGRMFTRLVASLLWLDFKTCFLLTYTGIHLPGLSCYCVCRKSL